MPLGQENQSNDKAYFLRIRTQDKDKQPIIPEFSVQEKNEEGKYVDLKPVHRVGGNLTSIKVGKRIVTNAAGIKQEIDDIKAVINDPDKSEVYFVDIRPGQLARNLYNALLNLKSGKNVSISLYQSKPKPNQDGRTYASVALRQNEELVKGLYERDTLPAPEEVKNKKGEVLQRDYSELNEFFFEKLKGLVASFKDSPAPKTTVAADSATTKKSSLKDKVAAKPVEPEVELDIPDVAPEEDPELENIPF